jgi:hypothetical protein
MASQSLAECASVVSWSPQGQALTVPPAAAGSQERTWPLSEMVILTLRLLSACVTV